MAIYNEEVNEIYPVQTFMREAMLKQVDVAKDKGGTKETTKQKSQPLNTQIMRSEARLNAFKQYFAKYNRRATSIQFKNEQVNRDTRRLSFTDALLEDIRIANEEISENYNETSEEDALEASLLLAYIPSLVKQNWIARTTERALSHRHTHDIVAHAYLVRPGAETHEQNLTMDVNKAIINERKYDLLTLGALSMKPTFVTNQMSKRDYEQIIYQAQLDYLILKMDNPNYEKPKSLAHFSDDPSVSWVQTFDFFTQDETSLQTILLGIQALESSAKASVSESILGLQAELSSTYDQSQLELVTPSAPPLEMLEPSAPPLENSQSNAMSFLNSLSMFQSGDQQLSAHEHRPTLSL